jgi:hypothetical protein
VTPQNTDKVLGAEVKVAIQCPKLAINRLINIPFRRG